jgi:hypothetical protein
MNSYRIQQAFKLVADFLLFCYCVALLQMDFQLNVGSPHQRNSNGVGNVKEEANTWPNKTVQIFYR